MRSSEKGLGIKDWLRGPGQKDRTGKSPTEISAGRERIAILPFVNISPDPKDEYFADGMTEELISTLSKIHPLKVISRTSVMRYKRTEKSVRDISKELNVGSILEGSVRKDAIELRITVKLIDVQNDEHVWSQDYEKKMENVFAVQKEIAKNAVESLRLELLPKDKRRVEKQGTRNVEAYELYLKGRFLWNKRSLDSMREAIEFFRAATTKDPSFALPHVGIADCYSLLTINGYLPGEEGYPKAKQAIRRALELDEALAEAHASLGLIRSDADWDWVAAEREYRRAIEINPNYATAHQWLSILMGATLGRTEEGIVEAKKALELDPLSPAINLNIGNAYLANGNLDLSEKQIRRSLELQPGYFDGFESLMMLAVEKHSYQEAVGILEKMRELSPSGDARSKISMAYVYARSGDLVKAKQVFDETMAASRDSVNFVHVARYYVGARDLDRAFEMLDQAFVNHDRELCFVSMDPWLRGLSSDPRFKDFLKKMKVR